MHKFSLLLRQLLSASAAAAPLVAYINSGCLQSYSTSGYMLVAAEAL
jgi:hypothetical protein